MEEWWYVSVGVGRSTGMATNYKLVVLADNGRGIVHVSSTPPCLVNYLQAKVNHSTLGSH